MHSIFFITLTKIFYGFCCEAESLVKERFTKRGISFILLLLITSAIMEREGIV